MNRDLGLSAVFTALALALMLGLATPVLGQSRDERATVSPATSRAALEWLIGQADSKHAIVELTTYTTAKEREDLRKLGLDLLSSCGPRCYYATVLDSADVEELLSSPVLASIRLLSPANKLHPRLQAEHAPLDIRLSDDDSDRVPDDLKRAIRVGVYVSLFPDSSAGRTWERVQEQFRAIVRYHVQATNLLYIEIAFHDLERLAKYDDVRWIEPATPAWGPFLNSVRNATEVDQIREGTYYDLTGDGVHAMVYDTEGLDVSHDEFSETPARVFYFDSSNSSNSIPHTNHVTSILAGNGSAPAASGGDYTGIAPKANIYCWTLDTSFISTD